MHGSCNRVQLVTQDDRLASGGWTGSVPSVSPQVRGALPFSNTDVNQIDSQPELRGKRSEGSASRIRITR
jgi:hypothetical protein